ncbi:Phospholipase/carboxylesterase, partial [Bombardia bombarda]
HTHTVVFLHGRGDNARKFASSLPYSRDSRDRSLMDAFPSFRWVFPQAPIRSTVTQWFDVWNVHNLKEREDVSTPGLRESVAAIRRLLAREAAQLDGRWDRVVLAGISMGCATSVHTLFHLDDVPRLGAFLGFSGRCPFAGRPTLAEMRGVLAPVEGASVGGGDDGEEGAVQFLRKTPMLLEHCANDPLVLVQYGRQLRDTLRGFGAQVEWKEYPDGGHWFHSPTGTDDVVSFL